MTKRQKLIGDVLDRVLHPKTLERKEARQKKTKRSLSEVKRVED